ncbi:MAG: PilZ domain-containing protein [Phycisphaerales bacterium]|nr:MAG: PilZ domain-containing protein [Phycisphaerales bacterium]
MSTTPKSRTELPNWVREALDCEPTDSMPNKRREPRHVWIRLAKVQQADSPGSSPISAKIMNASSQGIGLTSRQPLLEGQELTVTPDGVSEEAAPYETVKVRVIHCTSTIQGFKVGCVFVL